MQQAIEEIKELVLFNVDDLLCAIDISHIQEINKNLEFTKVYRAPDYVKGVLNLRGDIVTIIELRKKFQKKVMELNPNMRVIIVKYNDENVGLLVDDVNDVIEVDPKRIEKSATNMKGVNANYFQGLYKLDDRIVVILNIEEILKVTDRSGAMIGA